MHDFERNTRGVSGGLGAVTVSATDQCGTLAQEQAVDVGGDGLGNPVKEIQDTTAGICVTDWDDIEAWVKTIRPPRGLQTLDAAAVGARRAAVHRAAMRRLPRRRRLDDLEALLRAVGRDQRRAQADAVRSAQHAAARDACDADRAAAGGQRQHRRGDPAQPGRLRAAPGEHLRAAGRRRRHRRAGEEGRRTAAPQGAGGYNVPALYGLAAGAPYLHHGQARTLKDVFADGRWATHLKAATPPSLPARRSSTTWSPTCCRSTPTPPRWRRRRTRWPARRSSRERAPLKVRAARCPRSAPPGLPSEPPFEKGGGGIFLTVPVGQGNCSRAERGARKIQLANAPLAPTASVGKSPLTPLFQRGETGDRI